MASLRPLRLVPLLACSVLFACEPPGGESDEDGDPDSTSESAVESEPGALSGITALHNQVRAQATPVPSPPLQELEWAADVAAVAQAHADRCRYGHSMGELGENLFATAGQLATVEEVVAAWGDESADYTLATNSCTPGKKCGHYTQIVWRDTTRLGCGVTSCKTGSPFAGFTEWQYWVCNYDPIGNWQGETPY